MVHFGELPLLCDLLAFFPPLLISPTFHISPDNSFKLSMVYHSLSSLCLFAFVSVLHSFNSPAFLAPQQKPPDPYQKGCVLNTMCTVKPLSPSFDCPAYLTYKLFEAAAIL